MSMKVFKFILLLVPALFLYACSWGHIRVIAKGDGTYAGNNIKWVLSFHNHEGVSHFMLHSNKQLVGAKHQLDDVPSDYILVCTDSLITCVRSKANLATDTPVDVIGSSHRDNGIGFRNALDYETEVQKDTSLCFHYSIPINSVSLQKSRKFELVISPCSFLTYRGFPIITDTIIIRGKNRNWTGLDLTPIGH